LQTFFKKNLHLFSISLYINTLDPIKILRFFKPKSSKTSIFTIFANFEENKAHGKMDGFGVVFEGTWVFF
jgi:hypothetical protein